MERYRLKNIIILILALLNVFLLISLGIRGTEERNARRIQRQELVSLFAADGMTLDPGLIPEDTELSVYTLPREEALEKNAASFWLGSVSERTAQGGGIYTYSGSRGAAIFRDTGSFDIAGACYPECHPEAPNMDTDIRHLKEKVDAGASHLITQLFFDNDSFYDFRYRAARAGVNVPSEAGIMPVTNRKQIERMVTMCGASLPRKFTKMVQRFEDNPDALRDAGIAYAIDQIVDLVTDGVDGIHLYTMNNPYVARKISEAVGGIIKAATKC